MLICTGLPGNPCSLHRTDVSAPERQSPAQSSAQQEATAVFASPLPGRCHRLVFSAVENMVMKSASRRMLKRSAAAKGTAIWACTD